MRRALPAEVADRLEAACQEGGVSLFATGSSPGFISDVAPIALLFLERSLDTLLIEEFADLSQRDSPKLLFEVMGMGRRPGAVDERRAEHMRASFGPPLEALAERIGVAIDRVEATTEVAVASRRVTIAAGDIEAGCIAAQRTTVDALAGDDARLSFRATWYCTDALDADWPLGDHRLAGDRRGRCAPEGRRGLPDRTRSAWRDDPGLDRASCGQLGGGGLRRATRRADQRRPRRDRPLACAPA